MNIAILSSRVLGTPLVTKKVLNDKIESCMNDLEINVINRIKNGDTNSFEQIVEKYKEKAFTLTLRILKNRDDAEDSLQESFIKTFRAIMDNQFEERSKFSTYLYRIVYNTALDYYKRHKSRSFNLLSIDGNFNKPDSNDAADFGDFEMKIDKESFGSSNLLKTDKRTFDNELQVFINKFLAMVPEKYSVILTLFYINDLSHEEISQVLKIPLGTVKNRIFRAKEKMKELITRKYSYETIMELI
jgi:RNA polymerase sigma-70 factor (ECF subfamily)